MGTELHYSLNPLPILLKNNHDTLTKGFDLPDTQINSNNRQLKVGILAGLDQILRDMDKPFEEFNQDYVKKIILKHEEIFKQQVCELHRLYRIQKILMTELRSMEVNIHSITSTIPGPTADTRTKLWSSASTSEASNCSYLSTMHHSTIQCSRDLSLRSEDHLRMNAGLDLGWPAVEDASVSQNHSKEKMIMGGSHLMVDGEDEIELTLSIGCGASRKKSRHGQCSDDELDCYKVASNEIRQLLSTVPHRSNREEGGEASTTSSREKLQGPPWLIQTLSLKKT